MAGNDVSEGVCRPARARVDGARRAAPCAPARRADRQGTRLPPTSPAAHTGRTRPVALGTTPAN
eukprot:scaffold122344_cov27-Tisochrysis_lutea.AAC.2